MNALLASSLAHFRRRLRLVRFAAYGTTASIVSLACVGPLFAVLETGTALWITFMFAFAGFAVALLLALIRTPTIRRIAQLVDTRLALDDRVVTALQHQHDADVVSRLVVRDAAARLDGVSAADVFPFRAPPRLRLVAAAALATSTVALATLMWTPGTSRVDTSLADGSTPAGAAASVSAAEAGQATRADGLAANAPAAAASEGAQAERAEAVRAGAASGQAGGVSDSRGNRPQAPSSNPPATQSGSIGAPNGLSTPSRTPADRDAGALGSKTTPGNPADGGPAPGGPSGRNLEAGRLSSAPGQGTGATVNAPGGRPHTEQSPARVPRGPAYAARYRESLTRAEAAVASEHVSPGMRAYVKAYFRAIRPR